MDNCGLKALSNIKDMRGVSAFTLIHLAKDNGLDLKIFKVKEKDLPLVHRPAIFHSDNHFTYVKNGEALPKEDWSGYVLTQKSIGQPISHKDAKAIVGEDPITAIVAAVVKFTAAVVVPAAIKGAAVGAIGGGITGAISGQGFAQGALNGAKFGAITGGVTGGLGNISGFTGAGGNTLGQTIGGVGKAIEKGSAAFGRLGLPTQGAIVGAGVGASGLAGGGGGLKGAAKGAVGGFGIGAGISGIDKFGAAFNASKAAQGANATFGTSLTDAFKSVSGVGKTSAEKLAANNAEFGATPGFKPLAGSQASGGITDAGGGFGSRLAINDQTGAGIIGAPGNNFSRGSVGFADNFISGIKNDNAISALGTGGGTSNTLSNAAKVAGGSGSITDGFKRAGAAGALQVAGSAFAPEKPKGIDFDPQKEFSVLRDFLGDQALPAATEKELVHFVNTPLSELTNELAFQNDRVFKQINKSFDLRDQNIERVFASAGQNPRNSSEAQAELRRSQEDRATALSEAQQELGNENLSRGIQAKQFALSSSIQQNQFDDNLALELADVIGQKAALEASIQTQDFESFQNIMAQVMQIGFGSRAEDVKV
jgi:hypothetical protein